MFIRQIQLPDGKIIVQYSTGYLLAPDGRVMGTLWENTLQRPAAAPIKKETPRPKLSLITNKG